eukprot:4703498-Pyramimonas_sp.AAC.2
MAVGFLLKPALCPLEVDVSYVATALVQTAQRKASSRHATTNPHARYGCRSEDDESRGRPRTCTAGLDHGPWVSRTQQGPQSTGRATFRYPPLSRQLANELGELPAR